MTTEEVTDPPYEELPGTITLADPLPGIERPSLVSRIASRWQRQYWYKIGIFIISLFTFILGITLMKDGARALSPLVQDHFAVHHFADALGFGWFLSYVIMSGSPVAAAGLTLLDAGVVDQLGAYGIIVGSRLGASFIVLVVGCLYVLRGRSHATSLSMGLLSLAVAGTIQLPAIGIGLLLLQPDVLQGIHLPIGHMLTAPLELILTPISDVLTTNLPQWAIFLIGLGLMLISFNLFDRSLPRMSLENRQQETVARFLSRPWIMFALGSIVTLVSMSVSISLSILVPLNQRELVRREHVIAYIMGANISTFVDTLLAAVLLQHAGAMTVVMAEMLSLTIVSMLVLVIGYSSYQRVLLNFVDWNIAERQNLVLFIVSILIAPLLLLLL